MNLMKEVVAKTANIINLYLIILRVVLDLDLD